MLIDSPMGQWNRPCMLPTLSAWLCSYSYVPQCQIWISGWLTPPPNASAPVWANEEGWCFSNTTVLQEVGTWTEEVFPEGKGTGCFGPFEGWIRLASSTRINKRHASKRIGWGSMPLTAFWQFQNSPSVLVLGKSSSKLGCVERPCTTTKCFSNPQITLNIPRARNQQHWFRHYLGSSPALILWGKNSWPYKNNWSYNLCWLGFNF